MAKSNKGRALPNLNAPVYVAPVVPAGTMSFGQMRAKVLRAKLDEQNARIAAQKAEREAAEKAEAEKLAAETAHNAALLACDARLVATRHAEKTRAEKLAALTGKPLSHYWKPYADFQTIGYNGEPIAVYADGVYKVLAKARGNAPATTPTVPRNTGNGGNGEASTPRAAWQDVPLRKDSRITLTGKGNLPRADSKAGEFYGLLRNGMTASEAYKRAGDLLPRSTLAASLQRFVVAGTITLA